MWISSVRPEEKKTIEKRFDVCYNVLANRINPQQAAIFLLKEEKHSQWFMWGIGFQIAMYYIIYISEPETS